MSLLGDFPVHVGRQRGEGTSVFPDVQSDKVKTNTFVRWGIAEIDRQSLGLT